MNIDKLGKIVINGKEYEYIDNLEIEFGHIEEDIDSMLDFTKNSTISCSGSLKASGKLLSIIRSLPKSKVIFGLDLDELEDNINKWVSEMEDTLLYCSVSSVKLLEDRVLMAELIYKTLD